MEMCLSMESMIYFLQITGLDYVVDVSAQHDAWIMVLKAEVQDTIWVWSDTCWRLLRDTGV